MKMRKRSRQERIARRRRAMSLIVVPMAVAVVFVMPSTAYAYLVGLNYRFDWTPGNGGGGRVAGHFEFTGTKSVTFAVDIQDLCNSRGAGDGYGVGFYVTWYPVSGGTAVGALKGSDNNGCGTGVTPVRGTITRSGAQRAAQPIACITDAGSCWQIPDDGIGAIRDNPYT